jgi:hypothetical protein
MKAKLLAGIAVTVLNESAAHPAERLPKEMLGVWCIQEETELTDTYVRKSCKSPLILWEDRYTEKDANCAFDKIKRVDAGVYLVHVDCKYPTGTETRWEVANDGGHAHYGNVRSRTSEEWQLINGQLKITSVPEI